MERPKKEKIKMKELKRNWSNRNECTGEKKREKYE